MRIKEKINKKKRNKARRTFKYCNGFTCFFKIFFIS